MSAIKDRIKEEIDHMPDELVGKVCEFISAIKETEKPQKKIHTYKLNGSFDQKDIRKAAYE